ncbi:MAG: chitobiase/beta-hexosaminidase C-terminal domain-containing protein [Prevotella sp.]|nr:chitobiase/beta-hexosaminidase C-terminal domain-containing protein [Prevotella sp.]
MKKTFTLILTALFLLAGAANAQNYRKWDFTSWSATTIANLQADAAASSTAGWSDIEKAADAGEGKVAPEATANNCFWSTSTATIDSNGTLIANGATIAETEGLYFGSSYAGNRSLAIAVNYPSTSLGTYDGPQYLWLGGGNKSAGSRLLCFTIPKVKIGQKMTFVVESHKPTDKRGISLFVNDVNNEANKIGESFTPTTKETYTWENWTLPEGITDEDGNGLVDILVYNTNGCHIYSIEIGDNTQKSKIAYLYQGAADATQAVAEGIANYEVEAIDIAATKKTATELQDYDAVIIAANVNDAAYAAELKNALGWTPIVNTSAALYDLWGLGTAVKSTENIIFAKQKGHSIFVGAAQEDPDSGINYVEFEGDVYGIQNFGDYFAKDDTLGIDVSETMVTAHIHNAGHNAYIYIPAGNAQLTANAIKAATNSKSKVSAAPKPVITLEYKDQNTNVTITSTVPAAEIFYTTDGSTPTEASTKYTGTFNLTAETTVKAVAKGDGYTLSDVAEKVVDLKSQVAAPAISTEQADGQTIVTITGEGDIWYNYSNSTDTVKSTKYTAPLTLKIPRTLYAFATAEGKVNSEAASVEVTINNFQPRIDVQAHMDANKDQYYDKGTVKSSAVYYFDWVNDKGAYSYYNTEEGVTTTTEEDELGDEKTVVTYSVLNPEQTVDFENGWAIRSRGQLVIWENQKTGENYGNKNGYNFETVDDNNPYFPATQSYITLADKNTTPSDATFPYNAYIVTTSKFAGPFDVVANIGSAIKPENECRHEVVFQVSADGNTWDSNWQVLGDTIKFADHQRLTSNVTRSYEGTDEVYVRVYLANLNSKVAFYDIYIANAGEKSQELSTGIVEQKVLPAARQAAIYSLDGTRQNGMRRGLNIVVNSDGTVKKILVK